MSEEDQLLFDEFCSNYFGSATNSSGRRIVE